MKVLFAKTKWEAGELSHAAFCERSKADGFDAVEVHLPFLPEADRIGRVAREHGLEFAAHISTQGATIEEHLESLERWFELALANEPIQINAHTGKDHFSFAESVRLFERAQELAQQGGIPLVHETHRGRALFACHVTRVFLEELPFLRLNADFSHWVCVAESDLADQTEALSLAMDRSDQLHARVGFGEGPQVSDPFVPAFADWLEKFRGWWVDILGRARARGNERFIVTPEFGPAPYAPIHPDTSLPLRDTWELNVRMREWLAENLGL